VRIVSINREEKPPLPSTVVHHRDLLVIGIVAGDAETAHDDAGLGHRPIDMQALAGGRRERRVDERRRAASLPSRQHPPNASRASAAEMSPTTTTAACAAP
jgi:hypothetical protein